MIDAQRRPGILLLGNYPPPFGGVPSHLRDLSHYLAAKGWSVHVLVGHTLHRGIENPAPGITVYRLDKWAKVRALLGAARPMRAHREFFAGRREYLVWLAVCRFCLGLIRLHDIKVISAYHIIRAGTLGAWLSEETSIPLITTIFGEIYARPEYYWARRKEVDFVAAHTSRWLSCSRHCAASARELDVEWDVQPLYYGVDLAHFRAGLDATVIRRDLGWAAGDPVIGFVGRMNEEMGLQVLLRAIPRLIPRLPSARFLICGTAGALTPAARALAKEFPGHVAVQTDVPYEELPLRYAAADVVVAPSTNERACLGLSIIEAMGCGKAVVASNVGGTREVIVERETGFLVQPRSSSVLADTIVHVLGRPNELRAMGLRGRARAEEFFDKDMANRRFESIVHDVLRLPGRSTPRVYNDAVPQSKVNAL